MVKKNRTFLLILTVVFTFLCVNSSDAKRMTHWSVASDNKTIQVAIDDNETGDNGTAEAFTAKGVDYGVVPINDDGKAPPYQDYSWGDPTHLTYGLIWFRDVAGSGVINPQTQAPFSDGILRQLGANSIRTYAWWKWTPTNPTGILNIPLWESLDWSVSPPVKFGAAAAPPGFAAYPAHDGHDQFLDLCWNNGKAPIYVLIGIGIDMSKAFPMTNPAPQPSWQDSQAFMAKTTQWLAQKYGNHPAVMGFVIGNETNSADTTPHLEYWQYLNTLHQTVKQYAPSKITLSAFQDDEQIYTTSLIQYASAQCIGRGCATVSVFIDPQGNPTPDDGNGTYRQATPVDIYALDAWGFNPYSDPSASGNVIPNFTSYIIEGHYATPANPKPKPLLLTEWGAPASQHDDNTTFHSPPNSDLVSEAPGQPGSYDNATAYQAANVIKQIGGIINENLTTNGGILSGGYVFEYADEWWKNNPDNNAATLYSHDANQNKVPWGTGSSLFWAYWDEEWFGLLSTAPNPHRIPINGTGTDNGTADDPVVNQWGWLNGGADVLTPRAGFYALQSVFTGFSEPPPAPQGPPKVDPENLVQGALGSSLLYWIGAANSPTHYDARRLPKGLSIDASQGIVHGTLAASGIHRIQVTAYNELGKDNQQLWLYVDPSTPVITNSGAIVTAHRGKKITPAFKVETNDASARIASWGLPPNLSINSKTGLLQGIPKKTGQFVVSVTAANSAGTGQGKFKIIVLP